MSKSKEEDISEKTIQIIIKDVPMQLQRQVKAICALKGKTLKDTIIQLLEDFVNENSK